jgi:hypothetical protein
MCQEDGGAEPIPNVKREIGALIGFLARSCGLAEEAPTVLEVTNPLEPIAAGHRTKPLAVGLQQAAPVSKLDQAPTK